MVEWFTVNLDFNILGIRSAHHPHVQDQAVDDLDDPDNCVQILLISLRRSQL